MSEPRIALQRWPFEPSVAHICEACDYLCAPGVTTCPKCRTVLGEFSRPVKIDPEAAAMMAARGWDKNPAPTGGTPSDTVSTDPKAFPWRAHAMNPVTGETGYRPGELLTRCPHCGGVLGIDVRSV